MAPRSVRFEDAENAGSNESKNSTLGDVIAARVSRRDVVKGALGVSVMSAITVPAALAQAGRAAETMVSADGEFGFPELHVTSDTTHHVAAGHRADVLVRWGDGLFPDAPQFDPAQQSPAAQAKQFGYNNDFIGYLGIDGRSDRGLLVVNHEYTNEELMFPGRGWLGLGDYLFGLTNPTLVDIEMLAHGGSVIEVEKVRGDWRVVAGSKYARRITALTPMRLSGPAAGHERMKTADDAGGTSVLGMINNCAGGITPWGTWLSCEENFNFYFSGNLKRFDEADAKALKRYGVPTGRYAWAKFHDRFDVAKTPNEPNRYGWVVEIDPFNPESVPVKRTAMGRFKHEGAGNVVNKDGRFVVYQGDDERFDYVYRFVTEDKVDLTNQAANKDILDKGTLSVAKFNADGSGDWLKLVYEANSVLSERNGFRDQGDVVIHARLAADLLGATKMDRPEDVEVSPKTGQVYVNLTFNEKRTETGEKGVNPANPRAGSRFGHIIEITPDGGDHAAATFRWDFLVKCGDPAMAEVGATFNPATSKDGWFGMPDNIAFDADGRLWVATDGNNPGTTGRSDGLWALGTQGTHRGTSKCFLQVPRGAELCGPCFTPDMETLFVSVQHPGEANEGDLATAISTYDYPSTRWPDFKDGVPPRPSILVITKTGGGRIGG